MTKGAFVHTFQVGLLCEIERLREMVTETFGETREQLEEAMKDFNLEVPRKYRIYEQLAIEAMHLQGPSPNFVEKTKALIREVRHSKWVAGPHDKQAYIAMLHRLIEYADAEWTEQEPMVWVRGGKPTEQPAAKIDQPQIIDHCEALDQVFGL